MQREEDNKWRERIEERVSALTAGQNVQDGRLDFLQEEVSKHEDLEVRFDELETKVNALKAVMLPDSLGNGGVISRLKRLENKDEHEEKSLETRLTFWGKVIAVLVPSAVLIFREWPNISQRWNHNIEELTAPHVSKKVHRKKVHKVVEEPTDAEEQVQE